MFRINVLHQSHTISKFAKSTLKLNKTRLHTSILTTPHIKSLVVAKQFATVKDGGELEKITPRSVDYSQWYANVIACSDMVDQSPVRGCMVIKPWGMAVWDAIRADLDVKIRESGAQNAYFPLFIPMSFLSKEAEHVEGFAKECAVVTHHRLCKSEDGKGLTVDPLAKLEEPLVVRPTSETIIWHMFSKWVQSHRDLPLKINQWANVVRWEVRTRPFLRTTEFLWQEGHTAHATKEDAMQTTTEAIDMYADLCENLLAVPCVVGEKSPSERFAGAEKTLTIEALMQNGWALQAGTSHFLGQNFAKAFDVTFSTEEEDQTKHLVWATSWGVSTRLIGALVMTHSDDKGLVLPPLLAPTQVVVMPILKVGSDNAAVLERMCSVERVLKAAKIRVKVDDRQHVRPGPKYFQWERKGLPIRIDIGPRDVEGNTVVMTLRHTSRKVTVEFRGDELDDGAFATTVSQALRDMQSDLLQQAKERLAANTHRVSLYAEMRSAMLSASAAAEESRSTTAADSVTAETEGKQKSKKSAKNASQKGVGTDAASKLGFYVVAWKCDADNEAFIKKDCSATIRCYPRDLNVVPPAAGVTCFYSGEQATHYAIFARAF